MPRAPSAVPTAGTPAAPLPSGSGFSREPYSAGAEKAPPSTSNLHGRPHPPPPRLKQGLGPPPAPSARVHASPQAGQPRQLCPQSVPKPATQVYIAATATASGPLPCPTRAPRPTSRGRRSETPAPAQGPWGLRRATRQGTALLAGQRSEAGSVHPVLGPAGLLWVPQELPRGLRRRCPRSSPSRAAGGVRGARPGGTQEEGTRWRPNSRQCG